MDNGYLCLVLHAHLPFVRHPEYDDFLEEDWLFEAISETYLPLINRCEQLLDEGVRFRLTISITPTLAAMLEDPLLRERYVRHVSRLSELCELEIERTRWLPEIHPLAVRYHRIFTDCRDAFVNRHRCDLLAAFRRLEDAGALEIITCGATHAFLPLMLERRNLWRAQILTAIGEHERHFGRPPRGIWLPECGFDPGVDAILREAKLDFFFMDAHGILNASPRPAFGVYAPVRTPRGVAALGRDLISSRQVWCAWLGYPGDFNYREFYRDVGWDLEFDYLRPYLHSDGRRSNLGIKYHRITGPTADKAPYDFERAREKAREHAEHFLASRREQAARLDPALDRPPLIVAPYDAELFGHWWYEGPDWLEFLLRRAAETRGVETITPSEYLERHPRLQVTLPSYSSWGLRGYAEHWLDQSNDWIYPLLHRAGDEMIDLANRFAAESAPVTPRAATTEGAEDLTVDRDGAAAAAGEAGNRIALRDRALRQAGRELLLAQSSDWAFILKAGTLTEYATRRSREHIENFGRLRAGILGEAVDPEWLAALESRNNLFPNLDYRVFADRD